MYATLFFEKRSLLPSFYNWHRWRMKPPFMACLTALSLSSGSLERTAAERLMAHGMERQR